MYPVFYLCTHTVACALTANAGMAGNDVLITAYHDHDRAQVTGIAGNSLDDLRIVTAAGFIESTKGPVIGIFHQYAHHGKGKSIHSVPQMQDLTFTLTAQVRRRTACKEWLVLMDGLFHFTFAMV